MFFWHFGLFEQPFGAAPDARFVFTSRSYREALAALTAGIDSGLGFSSLIGEPGFGKTTLLHALAERYAPDSRIAYIAATACSPQDFFHQILDAFELAAPTKDVNAMYGTFREMVISEISSAKRVILLVDDADSLSTSALDTLRLLSNFELANPRLLHVVLAGNPSLNDTLEHADLTSLQQRITSSARLYPLTSDESIQYLKHRLRTAGARETPVFTPDALVLIAEHGRGNPREINRLGLNAMNLACALRRKEVEEDNVREVLQGLDSQPEPEAMPSPGPVLVSDVPPPSLPIASPAVTSYTWGSQALAVAPAMVHDAEPIAAAAVHEEEPEKAPSSTPSPLPPPIDISDAVRALRADLVDDAPFTHSTPSRRRISRNIRRIFVVAAYAAGILICAAGIVLASRMAWKMIADHRAAAAAEAQNAATPDSTPAVIATKKSSRARSGKTSASSSSGATASSAETAAIGTQPGANSKQHQPSSRMAGYPRNLDEFRIPGMIIIPIPFERSPYAPPIVPAALRFRVEPIYPDDAKAQHLEGTVNIRLHLDRTGHVSTVLVLSGDRRLAKPALAAVRQWVFSPFQESGAPFEGDTTVSLQFMAD
jgi:TonB family protein